MVNNLPVQAVKNRKSGRSGLASQIFSGSQVFGVVRVQPDEVGLFLHVATLLLQDHDFLINCRWKKSSPKWLGWVGHHFLRENHYTAIVL